MCVCVCVSIITFSYKCLCSGGNIIRGSQEADAIPFEGGCCSDVGAVVGQLRESEGLVVAFLVGDF